MRAPIAAGSHAPPPARAGAVAFVLTTVVLDAIGMGLLIPVVPSLIVELQGGSLGDAAVIGGWLTSMFAAIQFLAGPVLGGLSDHHGRRPVLLASLAAFGLCYVLMGFATSVAWLFVAQALAGLFGATMPTAGAYIADVTSPENRTRYFGQMSAAFSTGLIIGPVLGGILAEWDLRLPFFVAAACCLANVAYGAFVLPESLAPQARRPFAWRRAHPLGALREMLTFRGLGLLLLATLAVRLVLQTLPTTWPYYTEHRFGWSTLEVGYSLGLYGATGIVVQALLTGRVTARFGNLRTARFGFLLLSAGYLGFAFAPDATWLVAFIPITVLGFMAGPAISSLMSRRIPSNAQGTLQGVIASTDSFASIATPLVMPRLFSVFSAPTATPHLPGMPYLVAALLALVFSFALARARGAGDG